MPVKIRLARRGRKKKPYYHIIVADSRAPRDGRFIEQIGSYNPMTKPATIDLDRDKALDWLMKGAQPTDTARAILRFKGVLYRKHLLRGVKKGALTMDEADKLYQEHIESREAKIAARFELSKKEKEDFWKALSGSTTPKAADIQGDEGALAAFQETTTEEQEAEAEETGVQDVALTEEQEAEAEETGVQDVAQTEAIDAEKGATQEQETAEEQSKTPGADASDEESAAVQEEE